MYRTGNTHRAILQGSAEAAAVFDSALRSFMLRVYNYMCVGLAVTAGVALYIARDAELVASLSSIWVFGGLFLALFIVGSIANSSFEEGSSSFAGGAFWFGTYAVLWGVMLAPMTAQIGAEDPMLLVRAALITTATFAGMSLFGYTTKANLGAFGSFIMMAVIGLLIAMLANLLFFQSDTASMMISAVVVLVFAGITAYETHQIKQHFLSDPESMGSKMALSGAMQLYGTAIVLFVHILNLLSGRD